MPAKSFHPIPHRVALTIGPSTSPQSWWQRCWAQLVQLSCPQVELAVHRMVAVAPLPSQTARLFVDELGAILEEFAWIDGAKVCNVQTSGDDWQLLLLIDADYPVLPATGYQRWWRHWQLWRVHRRLQGLLAINLLSRQHCPESILVCVEPMLSSVIDQRLRPRCATKTQRSNEVR